MTDRDGERSDISIRSNPAVQRRPEATGCWRPCRSAAWLRRRGHRRTAPRLLRQPVRPHLPAVRPLRRRSCGCPRSAAPIDPDNEAHDLVMSRLRRHEQGRTQPDQGPGPHRDGRADRARRPVPRRPPAVRLPARRRRPAPQPGQGRRRASGCTGSSPTRSPHRSCSGSSPSTSPATASSPSPKALTADGIPCPSAHDRGPQPAPHRRRLGQERRPGHPDQPPLHRPAGVEQATHRRGPARRRRRRPRPRARHALEPADKWVWSPTTIVHEPLIDADDLRAASSSSCTPAGSRHGNPHRPHRTRHPYILQGLLYCGALRPQDAGPASHHGDAYYRCRYPQRVRPRQPDRPPTQRLPARGR